MILHSYSEGKVFLHPHNVSGENIAGRGNYNPERIRELNKVVLVSKV